MSTLPLIDCFTVDCRTIPDGVSLHLTDDELSHSVVRSLRFSYGRDGVGIQKQLQTNERIYGLGEKTGFLNKRGRTYMMWNTDEPDQGPRTDPLYQSIPFSIHAVNDQYYGIFVDYPGRSVWDVGDEDIDSMRIGLTCQNVDIFIFPGPGLADVVRQYTEQTGKSYMPPLWSIGFHQSRYSYTSESAVRAVADNFRERHIPCDVIHLDIHYMNGYRVFTWDPVRFPDPDALLRDLHEQGFKVVTIVDPGVKTDPDYAVYRQGVEQDLFVKTRLGQIYEGEVWPGRAAFPDFSQEGARSYWAAQHRELLSRGVDGIWNDMNEPADFSGKLHPRYLFTTPSDTTQKTDDGPVSMEKVHNRYALDMCRATQQAFSLHVPERRPFVLTRAGYAGIQRHAAVWTGDNSAWWEHMAAAIPMLLNMGLSGIAFAGGDVGGFQENTSPELFARWMQLGAFSPFFRAHTNLGTRNHEPWSFGPRVEEIARDYIRLRYQLLPYWYGLMEQSTRTGAPILRPLMYEFPGDPQLYELDDQFMIGPALLAAPILRPGVQARAVYLPSGIWYDWWTGQAVEGGKYVLAKAPLRVMPLFVRAGSAVPLADAELHTNVQSSIPAEFRIFPPSDGTTVLTHVYCDDGISFDYRDDIYLRYSVVWEKGQLYRDVEHDGFQPGRTAVRVSGPDGTVLDNWDWDTRFGFSY